MTTEETSPKTPATEDEEKNEDDDEDASTKRIYVDTKQAAIGGGLAALVTFGGAWLVGSASGVHAHALLETALPRARTFCGTSTIALGNVLALMLTLLSLSSGADVDLKWSHYQRVKQVAFIDAITLIGAVLFYLLLNVPLMDSQSAASDSYSWWHGGLYYAILVFTSLLGGALISVVLMLYNTVTDIIRAIGPGTDSPLVQQAKEEAQEQNSENG